VNFLLDHDVPEDLARVLLREGHRVARVESVIGRTAPDHEVFAHAKAHGHHHTHSAKIAYGGMRQAVNSSCARWHRRIDK